MLSRTNNILEIGCFVGDFLRAVSDRVHYAYGTEWDSRARDYISNYIEDEKIIVKRNPEDFHMKFEKIFMFHLLDHIVNPIQFLRRLSSLLGENGKLYIEVPNINDFMVKTFRNIPYMNYYYKKAHLYNFNGTGIDYIVKQADRYFICSFNNIICKSERMGL